MYRVYACLLVFCIAVAVPGCGGPEETSLATEGASADDFAQYEADLAAANSEAAYEDENGNAE